MSTPQQRLHGRTAIITGASQGIGRATARLFAEEGANVVVADVNAEAGTAVVESIQADGGTASFVAVDVTDSEQVQAMVDHAVEQYGGVDILVNNAGITRDATLKKMSEEAFDQVVDVNLKGVFNTTKTARPHLAESDHGRVLNAASVVGLYGNFGQTNYVATKSGVIGMTKTWAREFGRDGVTVNAVAPGFIETPMVDTVPEKVLDQLKGRTPLGRLGTAEDIANAYLFLASDDASFITGAVLSVDGGLVL
ncbi:3-oxoacyl-ACP reductase [Longibacter salinarum]|uniref:3-oxoacyl-[acyl-carrier-protein] reductase n=1 Tax=Longibacter salinarum TaxID=1850348 RepID=A0A2A8CUN6_9BACT|nr:3-oxoacyl-ACP reductase FabG [Longibacter salinarum]PEN12259.1 3-oxoacyl-ACP reductase [Longibacter salinarum]